MLSVFHLRFCSRFHARIKLNMHLNCRFLIPACYQTSSVTKSVIELLQIYAFADASVGLALYASPTVLVLKLSNACQLSSVGLRTDKTL